MIWVFAGTVEGRKVVEQLLKSGKKVLASSATEYGCVLLGNHDNLITLNRLLSKEEMLMTAEKYQIGKIIDATHPFAVTVSRNIAACAAQLNIPLERIERAEVDLGKYDGSISYVKNYAEAASYLMHTEGNILLTTGSNHLQVFLKDMAIGRFIVRVLPTMAAMKKCRSLGLIPAQIIAAQGPFSKEFNFGSDSSVPYSLLGNKR